jgi:membrane protease YdiL (CAAX protease family)/ABC-type Na+ efflux pump permease subunit
VTRGAARTIFACELRRLLRDRRALLAAVVLPMVLYPVVLLGTERLGELSRESLAEREVRVALDVAALSADVAERLRARLAEEAPLALVPFECEPELARALASGAGGGGDGDGDGEAADWRAPSRAHLAAAEVLLVALPPVTAEPAGTAETADRGGQVPALVAVFDGASELSNEALRRAREALEALSEELYAEQLAAALPEDPARLVDAESRDVARAEDASGLALGRLLPLLAVLAILSGGSLAALDAFSAEREAGTLETLLVQPVPAGAVARGKFGAVLLTAGVALLGNVGSLVACAAAGIGSLPGLADGASLALPRLAAGALLFLPAVVLLSALLSLVCARAKSFRDGQHAVLPLTLLALLPAALALVPSVGLDAVSSLAPLAGSALAVREALGGELRAGPAVLSAVAQSAWAALAVAALARRLATERLLERELDEEEEAARRASSRRALAFGWASVGAVYLIGGTLQAALPTAGVWLTLCALVPLLALGAAWTTARGTGQRLRDALGLAAPDPLHVLGALALAPALALAITALGEWQQRVLPLPELSSPLEGLSLPALLAVAALAPGLFEELLFRGAIQNGLARDLPRWRVVLWQAVLFGAVHASIYRFLPTAALGAAASVVALRAGSVWPAMVLHATYNGILIAFAHQELALPPAAWLGLPLGALLLVARRRASKGSPAAR